MRLTVVLPTRFCRTPDGHVWNQGPPDCSFFDRYLEVFDEVNVISRSKDVDTIGADWRRVDGENVHVSSIPHYIGPRQYLQARRSVKRALEGAVEVDDAVMLRSGDILCVSVAAMLRKQRRPFGLEVIGDPHDTFSPGAISHPLRCIFRYLAVRQLRSLCLNASAVSYVTECALQKRYPPSVSAFSSHYSSIQMLDSAYANPPTREFSKATPLALVFVGSLAQRRKGVHILLDAISRCLIAGLDLTLTVIGDGQYKRELEEQSRELGIDDRVQFLGKLPGADVVREALDKTDVCVLPTLGEGLPRILIEAMARGLPCIATTVGGIPELLPAEDLVPPGDATALALKMQEVLISPSRLQQMSARNLKTAAQYHNRILTVRRTELYRNLYAETARWRRARTHVS